MYCIWNNSYAEDLASAALTAFASQPVQHMLNACMYLPHVSE